MSDILNLYRNVLSLRDLSIFDWVPNEVWEREVLVDLWIKIKEFVKKYRKYPSKEDCKLFCSSDEFLILGDEIKDVDANVTLAFLRETVIRYLQKEWIMKSADKLAKGSVVSLEDISGLQRISTIDSKKGVVDISKNVKQRIEGQLARASRRIMTTIGGLDKVLEGGFGVGEVACFMSPPGKGKTTLLVNVVYGALISGKNVLVMSLELFESVFSQRLYQRISEFDIRSIKYINEIDEQELAVNNVSKDIEKWFKFVKNRVLVNYVTVGKLTVEGLVCIIEDLKAFEDFTVDLVVIDYMDKMNLSSYAWAGEHRVRYRVLIEELRSWGEEKGFGVVTATQTNRSSVNRKIITEQFISESFAKVEASDIVIALCQTSEEREEGIGRLYFCKNRERGNEGAIVPIKLDLALMRVEDLKFGGGSLKNGVEKEKK